jgi:hypothetical protein
MPKAYSQAAGGIMLERRTNVYTTNLGSEYKSCIQNLKRAGRSGSPNRQWGYRKLYQLRHLGKNEHQMKKNRDTHNSLQCRWIQKQAQQNHAFLLAKDHLLREAEASEMLHHCLRKRQRHPGLPLSLCLRPQSGLEERTIRKGRGWSTNTPLQVPLPQCSTDTKKGIHGGGKTSRGRRDLFAMQHSPGLG